MVRKLKHHEQKLLRHHDFTTYKSSSPSHRRSTITRRYSLPSPEIYTTYNRLSGQLHHLSHLLSLLSPDDPLRAKHTSLLLQKLYSLGLVSESPSTAELSVVARKLTVSKFCRRRLGVVMTRLRMAENVPAANKLVEGGQVRVGVETVTDPGFFVGREMEGWVTWVEGGKIKKYVEGYRGERDDFDGL